MIANRNDYWHYWNQLGMQAAFEGKPRETTFGGYDGTCWFAGYDQLISAK